MKDRQRAKKEGISEAQEIERMRERRASQRQTYTQMDQAVRQRERQRKATH